MLFPLHQGKASYLKWPGVIAGLLSLIVSSCICNICLKYHLEHSTRPFPCFAFQTSAQQALMGTINTSMHAVQQAQADLSEVDNLPPLGQDMVSFSNPSEMDLNALGCLQISLVIVPETKMILLKLLKWDTNFVLSLRN